MNDPFTSLSTGSVNFGYIKEDARKELMKLLDKHDGCKILVWDGVLIERFSLIAEYSLFKEHNAKSMHYLKKNSNQHFIPNTSTTDPPAHLIFITRPILSVMDTIAECVRKEERVIKNKGIECHLYFVPWKSFLCIQKLEELGVYGSFNTVDEYRLDIMAMDSDILSMEYNSAFADLNLDDDNSPLFHAARALVTIQRHYGVIPTIYGKGRHAKKTCSLLQKMMVDEEEQADDDPSQIDRLLILDRSTDLLTPMLTQLTYEGLIDEAFGISNSTVLLPPEKFSNLSKSDEIPTEKKKVLLTSRDPLYSRVRDCNFNAVGFRLKTETAVLNSKMEERHNMQDLKLMRQFVSKIPQINQVKASLATHLNIAELVKEYTGTEDFFENLSTEQELTNGINTDRVNPHIEDCIFRKKPLTQVLRLLCLQSICNNGLKAKVYEYYKREIIQTYGYKHLATLHRLETVGLLSPPSTGVGWNYNTLRKSLRLIVDEVNEKEPSDISYVYSGYAPLSVRLAQILSHPGWRSIEEVLRILPGPTINDLKQTKTRKKWPQRSSTTLSSDSSSTSLVTLVFFIGGVTYAEMAALRFLSSRNDGNEYVIATTSIINGSTMLDNLTLLNE